MVIKLPNSKAIAVTINKIVTFLMLSARISYFGNYSDINQEIN
jgi:hypothetical protein